MEENNTNTENKTLAGSQNQIGAAIIVAGLLIAGAILLKDNKSLNTQGIQKPEVKKVDIKPINAEDHVFGNRNAKITVIEYSDTECPFCKAFHATMKKITAENPEVAWVYRHYPIPQLHQKAMREAEATECAFEQGGDVAFWKYINRIFEITPSNDGLPEEELLNIAEYVGLNSSSFYTCLSSGKYTDKIEKSMSEGNSAGVSGTPASFILVNGNVVNTIQGAEPYDAVLKKINSITK